VAISAALNYGGRLNRDRMKLGGVESNAENLRRIKNLLLVGCGTSMYACNFASLIYKRLHLFDTVQAVDGSEMTEIDVPRDSPGAVLVSQSGETSDLMR
jgi:glucosamine--fructose-6-phosphate aminotransferase (isomerizing)